LDRFICSFIERVEEEIRDHTKEHEIDSQRFSFWDRLINVAWDEPKFASIIPSLPCGRTELRVMARRAFENDDDDGEILRPCHAAIVKPFIICLTYYSATVSPHSCR
jgi:hypothetical protein